MKSLPQATLDKLNRETSRIAWRELQDFYDQGAVLVVSPGMDLVAVAAAIAEDDTAAVAAWLQQKQLRKADEPLNVALPADQEVWAVVVAPWVLVQPHRRLS